MNIDLENIDQEFKNQIKTILEMHLDIIIYYEELLQKNNSLETQLRMSENKLKELKKDINNFTENYEILKKKG